MGFVKHVLGTVGLGLASWGSQDWQDAESVGNAVPVDVDCLKTVRIRPFDCESLGAGAAGIEA